MTTTTTTRTQTYTTALALSTTAATPLLGTPTETAGGGTGAWLGCGSWLPGLAGSQVLRVVQWQLKRAVKV